MKNLTKGKLVYLSLKACKSLRVLGRKYPDKRNGKPLSYNKSVLLLLRFMSPGLDLAEQ
jgi:hypothetical protein